jgi:cupin fold WbuC family metalloprotein
MRTRPFNREVLYPDETLVCVDHGDIAQLKQLAALNERRRIRLCTHHGVHDTVHEMLIVHASDSYVRPHKHLNRGESFHVLEGKAISVFFDDSGTISDVLQLGDYGSGSCFYYRMDEPVYHTLLIESSQFIFHETTNGPFDPAQTVFAPWSPPETDGEAVEAFIRELRSSVAQFRKIRP